MYCKKCGKLLDSDEMFCVNCGTKSDENAISCSNKQQDVQISTQINSTNSVKGFNVLPLIGFIFAATGIGIFLVVVIVGLLVYQRVYLFDGYTFTKAIIIISIIFMLFGSIVLAVKLILILAKKMGGFPVKIVTRIISVVLIVMSLGLSVWGFTNAAICAGDYYDNSDYNNSSAYPSLYSAYKQANCSSPWATYNSSYIKVDTNPYDISGGNSAYVFSAINAINKLNSIYDVPNYVYDDIVNTSAVDGIQSYSNSRIFIYWRCDPGRGLEVTYILV